VLASKTDLSTRVGCLAFEGARFLKALCAHGFLGHVVFEHQYSAHVDFNMFWDDLDDDGSDDASHGEDGVQIRSRTISHKAWQSMSPCLQKQKTSCAC